MPKASDNLFVVVATYHDNSASKLAGAFTDSGKADEVAKLIHDVGGFKVAVIPLTIDEINLVPVP